MRKTRLRHRLLLIATVAIVPLAVMSAIALQALLEQQRHQSEEAALNLTRAMATAVDNELRLTISALQSLALTETIGSPLSFMRTMRVGWPSSAATTSE